MSCMTCGFRDGHAPGCPYKEPQVPVQAVRHDTGERVTFYLPLSEAMKLSRPA